MSNDIGHATIKVVINGTTHGVDSGSVIRKLNDGWKIANLTTDGYSLPLDKASIATIYFNKDTISHKMFEGYVNQISENKKGKRITYDYELYGREAFINYIFHTPSTSVVNAGSFIEELMTTDPLDYAYSIQTALYNVTISLDSTKKDYVYNFLKQLNNKHTINFYFDSGYTLHAFYGNDKTIATSLNMFTDREYVSNIGNVYNRITLYSDKIRMNDSDDLNTDTEVGLAKWKYKHINEISQFWEADKQLFPYTEQSPSLNYAVKNKGLASVYGSGATIDYTADGKRQKYDSYFICDLGATFNLGSITAIKYYINVLDDVASNTVYAYKVITQFLTSDYYPPEEVYFTSAEQGRGYLTASSGAYTINSGWHTISLNKNAFNSVSKDNSISAFRYVGIYIQGQVSYPYYIATIPSTIKFHIDGMQVLTGCIETINVTNSQTSFGVREYKPDNYGYVEASSVAELQERGSKMISNYIQSEESLRKLRYPGSVAIEVGSAVTLTFDTNDTTGNSGKNIWDIKEVTDICDNGHWIQELKVSHSPIFIPGNALANKLKKLDDKLRDIPFNDLINLQQTVLPNLQQAYDFANQVIQPVYTDSNIMHDSTAQSMTREEIIAAIYKWNGTTWAPEGFNSLNNALIFRDTNCENYVKVFPIISTQSNDDPLLVIDQGLVVKKDITAGGFIGANQGPCALGHGEFYSTEPPHIWLIHANSGYSTLEIKYWSSGTPSVERYAALKAGTVVLHPNSTYTPVLLTSPNGYLNVSSDIVSVGDSHVRKTNPSYNLETSDTALKGVFGWNGTLVTVGAQTSDLLLYAQSGTVKTNGRFYAATLEAGTIIGMTSGYSLSALSINVNKDWNLKSISNVNTLTAYYIECNTLDFDLAGGVYVNAVTGHFTTVSTTIVECHTIDTDLIGVNTINAVRVNATAVSASTYYGMPAGSLSGLTIDANKNWNGKNISNGRTLDFDYIMCNTLDADLAGANYFNGVTGHFTTISCTIVECHTVDTDLLGCVTVNAARANFNTVSASVYVGMTTFNGGIITGNLRINNANAALTLSSDCVMYRSTVGGFTHFRFNEDIVCEQYVSAGGVAVTYNIGLGGTLTTNNIAPNSGNTTTFTRLRGGTIYASSYENLPAGFSGSLSNLVIDANKDWNAKDISNVKKITATTIDSNLIGCNTLNVVTVTGAVIGATIVNASTIYATTYQNLPSALSIQRGSVTTNASGLATITFSTAFSATPIITCTPRDASGRNISAVIVSQSSINFVIKTSFVNEHTHASVGNTGNDGGHYHYGSDTTDGSGSHNHTYAGESGVTSHKHGITHANQNLTTGVTSSHSHSYVDYYVSGNETNNESSHTHTYSGNASTVDNHAHGFSYITNTESDHSHSYANHTSTVSPVSNISVVVNWIAIEA